MTITNIKLYNFKSYKGHHTIGPFDRFSCIVGPNGSGKSNIIDALCFAFATHTSNLRADILDEMITKNCDTASVTVTLTFRENDIERNCTLKREIARKQPSCYYIDGVRETCNHYTAFLEMHGVFGKVKNFIIFQGEIDSVANRSGNDLTKMIEAVSGSGLLKNEYTEKHEKMEKLFASCSVLLEKKKNIGNKIKMLKENKECMKRFKEKVKRKDVMYLKMKLGEINDMSRKYDEISEKIDNMKIKKNKLNEIKFDDLEEYKVSLYKAQKIYLELENSIDEINEKIKEEEKNKYEKETNLEKIKNEEKTIKIIQQEVLNNINKINKYKEDIKKYKDGFELIKEQYGNKENALFCIDENIENEYKILNEKFQTITALDIDSVNKLKIKIKPQKEKIKQNERNIIEFNKKLMHYEKETFVCQNELKKLNEAINANKNVINVFNDKKEKGNDKYEKFIEKENNLNKELNKIIKNLFSEKAVQKEDERKIRIRDAIETMKITIPGVHGRFIDLITPTQKRYEVALSVLIGSYDQAVIVDDEKIAIECIKYIKSKRLGRITFLPLNSLRINNSLHKEYREIDVLALDTLNYDPVYQRAAIFVMKDSLITETIDKAKQIVYKENVKAKVVTLDGVLFHQNGNITAGKITSKFSENNFNNLLKEKNKILDDLREITKFKNHFGHIEIANERIKSVENENNNYKNKINEENLKLDYLQQQIITIKKTIEELNIENRQIEFDINHIENEIKKIDNIICKNRENIFDNFKYKNKLNEFTDFYNNQKTFLIKKEAEFSSIINNIEFEIRKLSIENDEKEKTIQIKLDYIGSIRNILSKSDFDTNLNDMLKEKELELKNIKKTINKKKCNMEKYTSEMNLHINKINKICHEIVEIEKQKYKIEEELSENLKVLELEEICIPLINDNNGQNLLIDKEKTEYLCNNDDKENEDALIINKPQKNIKNNYSKNKYLQIIKNIDFSQITESVEFYKNEYQKICKEIEQNIPTGQTKEGNIQNDYYKINFEYEELRKTALKFKEEFDNIKKNRYDLFMNCYEKINETIGNIYKELSKCEEAEGNAYLLLENSTEPYKEGLKYFVMPPKKRFREMKMLSGGEKTIAALSFILALNSFKPSSFYIFDELDSALDKINIKKVIEFILKSNLQFITVTLKPEFFQYAEGLVGIYKVNEISNVLTYKLN
ncbi:Structural maintenance of chromosomes protein 1 [Conglomerata obtusa]